MFKMSHDSAKRIYIRKSWLIGRRERSGMEGKEEEVRRRENADKWI